VTARFNGGATNSVPATVYRVKESEDGKQTLLILKCGYMNSALSILRKVEFDVVTKSYTGLKISKEAVRFEKREKTVTDSEGNKKKVESQVEGVYVVYGSELRFKEIKQIYAADDYVICDNAPDENEIFDKSSVLKIYDEVVVKGRNLYDEKNVG
jgi:hypothetical protein